ncbi:MAG: carboxypeptidase regulatory-like domain-containing protein, partial [Vicinamibacterales bacterium]
MKLRGIALFAAIALLAGCVSSGGPARPTPTPPPVEVRLNATLAFAVVDADTGRPIEGARVDVDQVEGDDDGRTDGNGYWSRQLRQGPIAYEVHADGYAAAAGVAELAGPP